jgi:hypothetical protein
VRPFPGARPLGHQAAVHGQPLVGLFPVPHRSRHCQRAGAFRAIPSRPALSAFICSATFLSHLHCTGTSEPCRPATSNGPTKRGEPGPIRSLAEVVADVSRIPSPEAELPERLRTGLRDNVRAHMLADVEVDIFLSAGVDSGSLLGVMRDVEQQQVRAITLAFKEYQGTSEDETPLAASAITRSRSLAMSPSRNSSAVCLIS